MGIETIVGAALSAVGTVGGILSQRSAARAQRSAARRQADEQREQNAIRTAQQRNEQAAARRQRIRERRVRAAQIQSQAELAGVGGSSGELGAQAALGTNLGQVLSQSQSRVAAQEGLTASAQRAADARVAGISAVSRAQTIGSIFQGIGAAGQLALTTPGLFDTSPRIDTRTSGPGTIPGQFETTTGR